MVFDIYMMFIDKPHCNWWWFSIYSRL